MGNEQAVLQFVASINEADSERLATLMTEDHIFIDSDGSRMTGRRSVQDAWRRYFSQVSGYRVNVEETYCAEDRVVLIGVATGMFASAGQRRPVRQWSVPAAWRAVVAGGQIEVWQVFVNPEPMRAAMGDQTGGTA